MSRFTTELRFMLETQNNLEQTGAASDVNTVVNNTRTWLFDFEYPCSELSELEKAHLEKCFMLHYYTREIGFETFGLFKQKLQAKLWMIMPKYNKLYAVEHENLDFFSDVDWHKVSQGKTNKRTGSVEHANTGKQTNITTGGYSDTNSGSLTSVKTGNVKDTTGGSDTNVTTGSYTDQQSGHDIHIFSDTPQSEIDLDTQDAYMTTADKDIKGSGNTRTYTNLTDTNTGGRWKNTEYQSATDTNTDTRATTRAYSNLKVEDENLKKLTDTFNNLLDEIDLDEHTYGNMGDNIDKLIKYRDNVLNLEQMIVNECSDLFMLLWY